MASPGIVLNDVKRKDMLLLDISCIQEYPNTRHFPVSTESFKILKDSIRVHGQIEPILVNEENGQYWAYTGHNRLAVIKELVEEEGITLGESGRRRVMALKRKADGFSQFTLSIIENAHRANTSAVDDAYNIQKLEQVYAQCRTEIATLYGKSEGWVSQRLNLLNLSDAEQEQAHNKEIGSSTAYKLSTMAAPERQEVIAEFTTPAGKIDKKRLAKAVSGKDPRRTVKEMALTFEAEATCDTNSEGAREVFKSLKEYAAQDCEAAYVVEVVKRWAK